MYKLDKLIQEFCPNGVEITTFGKVVNYEQPSKYVVNSTNYSDDFNTPVLTAGQTFVLGYTDETDGIYYANKDNPVIIFDDFTGAFKWVDFPFKVKSSAMKLLTADEAQADLRYIYHMMGYIGFTSDEHKRLWIGTYSNFKLPIPPLPVQQEIVRILDNFTELTAELTARKKQYEYYLNILLNYKESKFSRVSLKECTEKISNIKWKKDSGYFEYIDLSSVDRESHKIIETTTIDNNTAPNRAQQIVYKNDILFGSTRPMLRRSCIIPDKYDGQICSTGFCVLRADETKVLPKWIYYSINTNSFYKHVELLQKGASYPAISDTDVKNYEIHLPPLKIQKNIINILDRFETLCNDITSGLPAEIEARQKQYEYYRDKLLTFKPLEV